MTTFDDRERSFENKFAHDQELAFKLRARRSRLLAEWVAQKLGLPETQWHDYAVSFAAEHSTTSDDETLLAIDSSLRQAGIKMSFEELKTHWEQCDAEAREALASS